MTTDTQPKPQTLKIKLPSLVVDVIELIHAIQNEGAFEGSKYLGFVGRSHVFEMPREQVKSFISECYERSGSEWDCDWKEKCAFNAVAKRLQKQLDKTAATARTRPTNPSEDK